MSKYCKHCGSENFDEAGYCENCGRGFALGMEDEPEIVDVVIERPRPAGSPAADAREVRERLIGTKQEYYLPRFESMKQLNSFVSWNWSAFIVSTAWLIYRKMYVFAIVVWLISNLLAYAGLSFLSLLLSVGVGILGNFLYMKDIDNRVEKAMNMQPDEREAYIRKNSGTGWAGVVVLFVLSMLLNMVLY